MKIKSWMLIWVSFAPSLFANPQDLQTKALELVKAQNIPWYGTMHFDQAVPPELIDVLSLRINKTLGDPQSWEPGAPRWLQYRINIQNDVESKLRTRLLQVSETPASSEQHLGGRLARSYAQIYTAEEIAQALDFYQSAAGKKYGTYLRSLRRLFHQGQLFWEWQALKNSASGRAISQEQMFTEWMQARSIPAEQAFSQLGFEWTSLERVMPGAIGRADALALLVAMEMGQEAIRPLHQALSLDEKRQITVFHDSSAGKKERIVLKQVHGLVSADHEWAALMHGYLTEQSPFVQYWLGMRRHILSLDHQSPMRFPSASVAPLEKYELHLLEKDGLTKYRECLAEGSIDSQEKLRTFIASKNYQRSSTAMGKTGVPFLYVTRSEWGACVPLTQADVPVLSKESLVGTIALKGLTPSEQTSLLNQSLSELIQYRASSILLLDTKGQGTEINFAFDITTPIRVTYNTRYLVSGTFQQQNYRFVMHTPNLQSVSVSANLGQRGEPLRFKHILTTAQEVERDVQMRSPNR